MSGERMKSVFFDCRDCGWSTGANNEAWAVDIILTNIEAHLRHDPRHLGLPRNPVAGELQEGREQ